MALTLVLRLDGVRGDCKIDGYVDWIPLLSLSYGTGGGQFHSGRGGGVGDKTHNTIVCTAFVGAHSAAVLQACVSGRVFNGRYESFDDNRKNFVSFSFQGAIVTNYTTEGAGSDRPVDSFELDMVPFRAEVD